MPTATAAASGTTSTPKKAQPFYLLPIDEQDRRALATLRKMLDRAAFGSDEGDALICAVATLEGRVADRAARSATAGA